jgi:putative membrane protein
MTTLLALTAAAQDDWHRPAWWPVFPLLWFLLLAGLATTFVVTRRRREELSGRRAGERVLAERYAAGDLDETEYTQRLAVLRRTR